MQPLGLVGIDGSLAMKVTRKRPEPPRHRSINLSWRTRNWFAYRLLEVPFYLFLLMVPFLRLLIPALVVVHGRTALKVYRGDGTIEDLGLAGRHLVVTAGKQFLAACMDGTNSANVFKFHGFGTGTTAAASGDTALQTELTTQYAVSGTRPTGSQAHSTVTYTTVATLSPGSGGTIAVTEWGLFSQAAAGGTLLDHQVFSAVNLVAGSDSLQTTYVLTYS